MDKIIKGEEKQKLKEQKKQEEMLAAIKNYKKPTNKAEVKAAFANKNLTQGVKAQFVALMSKATNTNADKESKANSAHRALGMLIGDVWSDQKDMHANAIKFFKATYNMIRNDTPGMSVAEKIVAAQKMTDIMLNTYSPIASNPSLARFGESYAVQKIDNNAIRELTGFEGNVDELMNTVKVELGIGKVKVDFGNEFGEAANDKSAKVEEHNAPVVENVKQS